MGTKDRQLHRHDPLEIKISDCGSSSSSFFSALPYKTRIYNRAELSEELELSGNTADDEILRVGYQKYGNGIFNRASGSFLFIHLDDGGNNLTIASGCECTDTLFYRVNRNSIVISRHLVKLLESPGIPTDLNIRHIASVLSHIPQEPNDTCYQHIKRLPPGHLLIFNASGVRITPYWRFQNIKEVYYKKDTDYIENFLELYRNAVKARIAGSDKTGISLSGGLDSGTVAILAAEELAKTNKRLYSYTSVPLYDSSPFVPANRFGDESEYVRLLCRRYTNITPKFLNAENVSPVDGIIKTLDVLSQPLFAAANMFSLHNLQLHAAEDHIDTWLIGKGGNVTVSFFGRENHSKGPADLIRNFNCLRLFHGKDKIRMLINITAPETIMNVIGHFRPRPPRPDTHWRNFSAVNPAFAEKLGIADIQPFAKDAMIYTNFRRAKFENYFRGVGADFRGGTWVEYGLRTADPTYDRKLLEFCFGIPDEQYRRYGISRFLIRRAFNGKMPQAILWNQTRGKQTADLTLRVGAESGRIENIIGKLKKSDAARELLDLEKMAAVLSRVQTERTPAIASQTGSILLRGVMVGLFLLRHEGDKNCY
ncbi:MAG: asparagine synthase-related protein [Victivallaceae bacterium]|nr:asparagine synthase-related protein [Victivallaceae bacterium]